MLAMSARGCPGRCSRKEMVAADHAIPAPTVCCESVALQGGATCVVTLRIVGEDRGQGWRRP